MKVFLLYPALFDEWLRGLLNEKGSYQTQLTPFAGALTGKEISALAAGPRLSHYIQTVKSAARIEGRVWALTSFLSTGLTAIAVRPLKKAKVLQSNKQFAVRKSLQRF
jgi:hypothetical protein